MKQYFGLAGLLAMLVVPACAGIAETRPTPTQVPVTFTASLRPEASTTAAPAPTSTLLPSATASLAPSPTLPPATQSPVESAGPIPGNPDLNFAQVLFVRAAQNSSGLWKFDVTVRHNDEGWDHYADAWQVVDPQGNVLAERILAHPHDTEQPFTRSQSNIKIPPAVMRVVVRAKCNVHGFGGQTIIVDLTASSGDGFEVTR